MIVVVVVGGESSGDVLVVISMGMVVKDGVNDGKGGKGEW